MSRRTKQCGSPPRPDGKARRLFQLMQQRQLQEAQQRASPYQHQVGDELPAKQQQTQHNIVSEGLPFGLFTSDQ